MVETEKAVAAIAGGYTILESSAEKTAKKVAYLRYVRLDIKSVNPLLLTHNKFESNIFNFLLPLPTNIYSLNYPDQTNKMAWSGLT